MPMRNPFGAGAHAEVSASPAGFEYEGDEDLPFHTPLAAFAIVGVLILAAIQWGGFTTVGSVNATVKIGG